MFALEADLEEWFGGRGWGVGWGTGGPEEHLHLPLHPPIFCNHLQANDVSVSLASFEILSFTPKRYFYS